MVVTVGVWVAVFVFSLLLMLAVREALALSLMFSAINAAVSGLFGLDLIVTSCVFLGSYVIMLAVIWITNTVIKRTEKRIYVDNAQKESEK